MKQFEKATQSIEALAEFLATDEKGDNRGCDQCSNLDVCQGKETCQKMWVDYLNSEVDLNEEDQGLPASEGAGRNVITVKINVDTAQLDEAIEKANQLKSLVEEVKNSINPLTFCPVNISVNKNISEESFVSACKEVLAKSGSLV